MDEKYLYFAPTLPQGMAVGSRSLKTVMEWPSTTSLPSAVETSPLYWPWVESYLQHGRRQQRSWQCHGSCCS